MADRAFDDDVEPANGDAAAGGRVAVDHEQAAAAGCARGLRRIAFDVDEARHHVLGDADAGAAVDDDGRLLVHAGAVIADIAVDLDGRGRIDTNGDGVAATRIEDPELRLVAPGSRPCSIWLSSRRLVTSRSIVSTARASRRRVSPALARTCACIYVRFQK